MPELSVIFVVSFASALAGFYTVAAIKAAIPRGDTDNEAAIADIEARTIAAAKKAKERMI